MKIILFALFVSSLTAFANSYQLDQYPEDRTYTSTDRGLRAYRALSVYKTGVFSLTFDDGPHETFTPQILDVLKKYNVKATFFVLTNLIKQETTFPIIKRMLDEGHLVASHGPSHDRSSDLTKAQWMFQTKKSFIDLANWYKMSGHEFTKHYYRFPYGEYGTRSDYHSINALKEVSKELMGDNCIHMAFWDIDTADWVPGMTGTDISQNIIAHNEGGTFINFKKQGNTYVKFPVTITNPPSGGVVLQHDVREVSVSGTELFIQYAQARGVQLVRLDEIEEFGITKTCKL